MLRYAEEINNSQIDNKSNSEDTIINSVKKMLGIPVEITDFDTSIISNINVAFSILFQLGVGQRKTPFMIIDGTEKYSDFNPDTVRYSMLPMYLYLKTKVGFDPPASGQLMESLTNQISEIEFRLRILDDPEDTFDDKEEL